MSKEDGKRTVIKFTQSLTGQPDAMGVGEQNLASLQHSISSSKDASSTYSAAKAFDGSDSTFWYPSAPGLNEWISWKIPADTGARRLSIRNRTGQGWWTACSLEAWNGSEWIVVAPFGWTGSSQWQHVYFDPVMYTDWRVFTGPHQTTDFAGISRIILYGGPAPINLPAFTLKGMEPKYIKFPSMELGPLQEKTIALAAIEWPEPNQIALVGANSSQGHFKNVEGDITVEYDMGEGNLVGVGGPVVSFTETYTPEGLARTPNPWVAESVAAKLTGFITDLITIYHLVVGDLWDLEADKAVEGPWTTADKRYQKWVVEPDPPDPGQDRGRTEVEAVSAKLTGFELSLTHVDDIDP